MIKHLKKIFSFFDRRTKRKIFFLGFIMLAIAVLEMMGIGLFLPILHLMSDPENRSGNTVVIELRSIIGDKTEHEYIIIFGMLLSVFFVVKNALIILFQFIQGRFIFEQEALFGARLFGSYLMQPYTFHLQRNSARLMHNVTLATAHIFQSGLLPFMNLVLESFICIGVFIAILLINTKESILIISTLFVVLGLYYSCLKNWLEILGRRMHEHGVLSKLWVNQGLGAIKETVILGRQHFFQRAFGHHRMIEAKARNLVNLATFSPRPIIETIAVILLIMTMVIVIKTTNDISNVVPTIGIFAIAAFRVLPSLNRIASNLSNIKVGAAAVEDIYDDVRASGGIDHSEKRSAAHALGFEDTIELRDINYMYPESDRPILKDISLKIRLGDSLALVGASGAGKTTLADILLGLLTPSSGEFVVDGVNVQNDIRSWQANLGYVPQHIYIFDDSVRMNIALGVDEPDIDDERLRLALKLSSLEQVVKDLPNGVDTVLGENGVRLSGGQRQRIGIARALYNDPKVLILDEATSALDSETERAIMDSINSLRGQKTLIIIAHRLSTVKNCDRLVLLNNGQQEAAGTYDELIEKSEMFRRQALDDSETNDHPSSAPN